MDDTTAAAAGGGGGARPGQYNQSPVLACAKIIIHALISNAMLPLRCFSGVELVDTMLHLAPHFGIRVNKVRLPFFLFFLPHFPSFLPSLLNAFLPSFLPSSMPSFLSSSMSFLPS
jgi:hypothetical protein